MREFVSSEQEIFPYIIIASAAGVLGGIVACFWVPKLNARSAIQHFAAGVVIAAVASELIPEVERLRTAVGILSGFAPGGLTMIGIKWLVLRFERLEESRHELPVGLAVAAAVDTLLDGAIISAGFLTQRQLGPLLAIALAVELFFLTLSVGSEFHKSRSKRWSGLAATTGIAFVAAGRCGSSAHPFEGCLRRHCGRRFGVRCRCPNLSGSGRAAGRSH
jgi:zinc transporter, ZIP family